MHFNLIDNPVWVFLTKCVDLFILCLLWILFSLPVVTVGASTAALYHGVHKTILNSEGYPSATFWRSFRTNWKQGILLTLLCLLPAAFCWTSWQFADRLGEGHPVGFVYRVAAVLAAVLTFSTLLYLFPLLSRFYMGTRELIRTAFALAVIRAGFTLLLDLVIAVCILGIYLIPASIFILPGLGAMAAERLVEPAIQKAMDASEAAKKESSQEEMSEDRLP